MATPFTRRILHVDLTTGRLTTESPPESFYRTYLGGSAMGLHYILKALKPGVDPLGPENVLTLMVSVLTGAPISGQSRMTANALSPLVDGVGDSQCGLRAFTRSALQRLELRTDGMELASEMILKAARRGLSVADVPVPYAERLGEAKLNTIRDGWRHLRFLLLASPNYLFTIPGAVLTVLGVVTLALALPSNRIEIGEWTWQPVFAGSIFVIVGWNALLLGFASRLYTSARGITNEDAMLRFYRRYLGLELFVALGAAAIVLGIALDLLLLLAGDLGLSFTDLAAIAQTLIIVGANTVLVGFVTSLLEGS